MRLVAENGVIGEPARSQRALGQCGDFRGHGTTRWQIYDLRKQLRKGNLVVPENVTALAIFA
ncbi:hypothetical protein, partial [Streptomyces javensis]|uniref:hypothetical protein n=1 Tax=Streptomyces javensis TaxID=114698 RepID=UPI0031D7AE36